MKLSRDTILRMTRQAGSYKQSVSTTYGGGSGAAALQPSETIDISNNVISLKQYGTAGTYYKVTTDAYGRVTSGATALSASDITSGWGEVTVGKAEALTVQNQTMWGRTYIYNGVPVSVSGDMSSVGNISLNDNKTIQGNGMYIKGTNIHIEDQAGDDGNSYLFLGNPYNLGYVFALEDIHGGENYNSGDGDLTSLNWAIETSGDCWFKAVNIGDYSNNYISMQLGTSGDGVRVVGGGLYADTYISALGQNTSSDARLKDITGNVELSVEEVAKAPSVKFRWRNNPELGKQVGTIAQYWQEVLPETVRNVQDGMLAVDYGVVAVTSAIAVARKVIEQEERIKELEMKIELLMKKLNDGCK